MKHIRLGKTNLEVSAVGFGGIPIIQLPFEKGVAVVRHAHSRGVTFFDTANVYGDSERKMGQALEPVREKVVLATKSFKRDGDSIARHITYSLENLRTSFIDIYQFHDIATEETLNEILAGGELTRRQIKPDRKVRYDSSDSVPMKSRRPSRPAIRAFFPRFNFHLTLLKTTRPKSCSSLPESLIWE